MADGGDDGTKRVARARPLRAAQVGPPTAQGRKRAYALHQRRVSGGVGHRPLLHKLAAYLLMGDAEGADIQIEKDGAACLSLDATPKPGAGSLHWLLTPEVMRAIAQT